MTKIIAEIELNLSPENKEHAQHVLDQWTKFSPLEITVKEVCQEE